MQVAAGVRPADLEAGVRAQSVSGVSWGAIVAGSVAATATTLLLLALAAGLDFASVSPWPNKGAGATAFTVMSAVGLIVIQWLAACIGGYLAGRLRTRWVALHTHEVFFRDTAHGFITWALSTLLVVAALASAATGLAEGGARA
jgi:predicted acylesterase/phospholipase RssA